MKPDSIEARIKKGMTYEQVTAKTKYVSIVGLALGGIANLIDRVFRDGHVVDYMVLNVGPAHTGVFNIADIAITVGALYLLIDLFVKPRKA